MTGDLHCRVCGLRQDVPPWGDDGKCPTHAICACCGAEFGYEDATGRAARKYRATWLAAGADWFAPEARPADWDRERQLRLVPPEFR